MALLLIQVRGTIVEKTDLLSSSKKALTSSNNIFTLRANALGCGSMRNEVIQEVYHEETAATHPLR